MLNRPKVLVVDGDKNILSAFEDFLRKEHCNFISASCINEAVANLLQQRIDLIIMDVNFKIKQDTALFKYIKKIQIHLPIIMITGYPDIISEKDAKDHGADYFFVKPLDLNLIRDAVRNILQLN